MVFDLTSFLAGIFAGGLTGTLAGILYGFERTADLQDGLLKLRRKMESTGPTANSKNMQNADSEKRMRELRAELDAINDEIRRMYRKSSS